jgi:hypothetical protein
MDLEGSGQGPNEGNILDFALRDWGKQRENSEDSRCSGGERDQAPPVMPYICIRKVLFSNLGRYIGRPDQDVRGFP